MNKGYIIAGLAILTVFALLGLFGQFFTPYDPGEVTGLPLSPPDKNHWLGTNDLGQDIYSQLLAGSRQSMLIAVGGGFLSTLIGVVVGLTAGYNRGLLGTVLDRTVNLAISIPQLPLMVLMASLLGAGVGNIILVLALLSWPAEAKLIRAQTMVVRNRQHIEAARLFGASAIYLLIRHILVELLPLVGVGFIMQSSRALLTESALAFLGLGDPAARSWGMIIRAALNYKAIYFTPAWAWWLLPPGICIILFVLSLNFLGYYVELKANRRFEGGRAYGFEG